MAGRKVLIVEDDRTLLDVLTYNLVREGYQVTAVADGIRGLELARSSKPDLLILDIMLPELDGLELCRILRGESAVPILMLTARTEEIDRVVGLELGADDYISKPFSMRELVARVRAALRRSEMGRRELAMGGSVGDEVLRAGELEVDLARHTVSRGGLALDLGPKEFDLLAFLMKNRGRVFSRDRLVEEVWGYEYTGDSRTVDVHIRWLRRRIEVDPAHPKQLITVRGVGYKFED